MLSNYLLFEQEDNEYPFKTVPELLRWAKKQKLIEKDARKPLNLKEGEFAVKKIVSKKNKKPMLNKKTGRIKKQPVVKYEITTIKPEDRTLENLPRYADKKPKVHFSQWLCLKKSPNYLPNELNDRSWGWSPNGKCYGWSHRAIHGFKIGDKMKSTTVGNNTEKEFVLKTNEDVERAAKKFAEDVS